jgi:hypothetical protein
VKFQVAKYPLWNRASDLYYLRGIPSAHRQATQSAFKVESCSFACYWIRGVANERGTNTSLYKMVLLLKAAAEEDEIVELRPVT